MIVYKKKNISKEEQLRRARAEAAKREADERARAELERKRKLQEEAEELERQRRQKEEEERLKAQQRAAEAARYGGEARLQEIKKICEDLKSYESAACFELITFQTGWRSIR